ncbi:hypothetical protein GMD58_15740 [Ruthenibacterium lactatiformans]|uniref:Uncharacterized protein n=2 Tax=Ruthenibacterium lactatiformans TaxID=1550024 RepID=A0A6I3QB98_9FIRM|nr:hypothetical protein [Ruthenibacterium lactatiformans]MTS18768.1 hypothetical protein [Ruthenibacterium lactatiformans]MTS36241.1 hypothetical protein [Ruthenibacterium lactatiformans]MTS49600.1 hypothetical protein [Ruthenibacterium lactatiformans]MTS51655.1 hypothetical protein [Ruthenibacterium lactatiformans]
MKIRKEDFEIVSLMTQACFYQGRLPLGFTSSPVLSDLYLVNLDRKYQADKTITYTRYADDFVVSASGPEARSNLVSFRLRMEKDLDIIPIVKPFVFYILCLFCGSSEATKLFRQFSAPLTGKMLPEREPSPSGTVPKRSAFRKNLVFSTKFLSKFYADCELTISLPGYIFKIL